MCMSQIVIKANESKLIPVLLGDVIARNEVTKQSKILNQVENDEGKIATSRKAGLAMTEERIDIILAGENASVEVVGLVIGKGSDEKSIEANIVHAAPNTKSNVNVRAVLRGRSTFAFRGNVKIEKGAKGSDAYLRSDALLFDDAKMGDDTPALEILEPDVKAGHAATIGKVDEQMLFYLMSRGLTRKQAEKLLVEGFVKPIMDKIKGSPPDLTSSLFSTIRTRLEERS
jgi:Fe-S cluster assembly scaffold protein SufB